MTGAYSYFIADLPIWLVQRPTVDLCTTVLTATSGARFDAEFGGSAARAALLANCRILSDQQFPDGTIFTHCEIGAQEAIIWIHHRPQDLLRVLQRLGTVLSGEPAPVESAWALQQLLQSQRPHTDPCSCISACMCSPRHRIRQRLVEALDPLPEGARRSGCSRRIKTLRAPDVDRWRRKYFRHGSVALAIETSLDLRNLKVRQHVVQQVRGKLPSNPGPLSADPIENLPVKNYLEPARTIISPPVIEGDQPRRVVAGWIVDQASPPETVPLLEPRVELWDEILSPDEPVQRGLLRLKAKRRARRIDFQANFRPDEPIQSARLALQLLRRNESPADSVLSRNARRPAMVTVLQYEEWP